MQAAGNTVLRASVLNSRRSNCFCRPARARLCQQIADSVTTLAHQTRDAQADLDRLFDFLPERQLAHEGGDLTLPTQAIAALRPHIPTLQTSSSACRKAGQSPFPRELNVPLVYCLVRE